MANIKFSQFTTQTDPANVQFVVGFNGTTNVKIAPGDIGGGATDLNGLSDCLVDTASLYVGEVPAGLSGNPQANTVLGIDAGNSLTTGANNTLIGNLAGGNFTGGTAVFVGPLAGEGTGTSNSTGNVAMGWSALRAIQTGNNNVAIGFQSGRSIGNAASSNTMLGALAGYSNTGSNTVMIGGNAGYTNTSSGLVNVGYDAGYSNTSGANNTNLGFEAGYTNTTGASRVMLGYEAGRNNTGSNNVFLGKATGKGAGSGSQTIAIGQGVMETGSAASNSVFIGNYMAANTTAGANSTVAIGTNCLSAAGYSAENNTVVGHQSGNNLSSGDNNTLMGSLAGDSVTTGSNLTVIGYDADASSATATNEITLGDANVTALRIPGLQSGASDGDVLTFASGTGLITLTAAGGGGATDLNGLSDCLVDTDSLYVGEVPGSLSGNPQGNTILGITAGDALTTGVNNTLIGNDAGVALTTAQQSTIIGYHAGLALATGNNNTLIGNSAGLAVTAAENTLIGTYAGRTLTSGTTNTMVGVNYNGGGVITGSNNTLLGNNAAATSTSVSNEITLGNSSVTSLRCAVTSITSLSDERDKSEIKDLGYGLAFIDALQPREFVWNNRAETRSEFDDEGNETEVEFYSANKGKKDFGFIAQEVKELDNDTLRLVYDENPERLELSYGKLVPVLVQAIKELKAEIELLKQ